MNSQEFETIVERRQLLSRQVLLKKAKEYATDDDRLHNFVVAASITGLTPVQMCWMFLVKHLVSIQDMIFSGKEYPDEMWDEKIGDTINYIHLAEALIVETKKLRAESIKAPSEAIEPQP